MVSTPAPVIVPPLWANTPLLLTELAPLSVRVFAAIKSVCVPVAAPSVSEATVELTSNVTVYVPAKVICTSSDVAGAPFGVQFVPTLQLPPAALFQDLMTAGANTASENSDVLPSGSVAVAVTNACDPTPLGTIASKCAVPSLAVTTSVATRIFSP